MLIYVYILAISLFFASILVNVQKEYDSIITFKTHKIKRVYIEYILLFLSMCPFILISGLRYAVGCDYFFTYIPIFENINAGMSFSDVATEPAFFILNKIISVLGGGTVWLFLITSAIIISLFWISFYQNSENLVISILMFFCAESFFISMAYVRQFISISIAFYCFKYIKEKKLVKYIIGIIIATLFHTSGVMFLPLYFIQFIKISPLILGLILSLSYILDKYIASFLYFIIEKMPYSKYIGSVYQSSHRTYPAKLIMYLVIFVIACFLYKKYKDDNFYIFMLNLTTIIVFFASHFNIIPQVDRIMFAFDVVLILFVPYIIKRINNKWLRQVVTVAIILVCSVVTYNNVVTEVAHGVIPYRFVFNPNIIFK